MQRLVHSLSGGCLQIARHVKKIFTKSGAVDSGETSVDSAWKSDGDARKKCIQRSGSLKGFSWNRDAELQAGTKPLFILNEGASHDLLDLTIVRVTRGQTLESKDENDSKAIKARFLSTEVKLQAVAHGVIAGPAVATQHRQDVMNEEEEREAGFEIRYEVIQAEVNMGGSIHNGYLRVNPSFEEGIVKILDSANLNNSQKAAKLKQHFDAFGCIYPNLIVFGGYVWEEKREAFKSEKHLQKLKTELSAGMYARIEKLVDSKVSIDSGSNSGTSESTEVSKAHKGFQVSGGRANSHTKDMSDWQQSLDDPEQCNAIYRKDARPTVELLSDAVCRRLEEFESRVEQHTQWRLCPPKLMTLHPSDEPIQCSVSYKIPLKGETEAMAAVIGVRGKVAVRKAASEPLTTMSFSCAARPNGEDCCSTEVACQLAGMSEVTMSCVASSAPQSVASMAVHEFKPMGPAPTQGLERRAPMKKRSPAPVGLLAVLHSITPPGSRPSTAGSDSSRPGSAGSGSSRPSIAALGSTHPARSLGSLDSISSAADSMPSHSGSSITDLAGSEESLWRVSLQPSMKARPKVFCALSGYRVQDFLSASPPNCPAQRFEILVDVNDKGIDGYNVELQNLCNIHSASVAALAIDPAAWSPNHVQAGREVANFPKDADECECEVHFNFSPDRSTAKVQMLSGTAGFQGYTQQGAAESIFQFAIEEAAPFTLKGGKFRVTREKGSCINRVWVAWMAFRAA